MDFEIDKKLGFEGSSAEHCASSLPDLPEWHPGHEKQARRK